MKSLYIKTLFLFLVFITGTHVSSSAANIDADIDVRIANIQYTVNPDGNSGQLIYEIQFRAGRNYASLVAPGGGFSGVNFTLLLYSDIADAEVNVSEDQSGKTEWLEILGDYNINSVKNTYVETDMTWVFVDPQDIPEGATHAPDFVFARGLSSIRDIPAEFVSVARARHTITKGTSGVLPASFCVSLAELDRSNNGFNVGVDKGALNADYSGDDKWCRATVSTFAWIGAGGEGINKTGGFVPADYLWSNDANWAGGTAPSDSDTDVQITYDTNATDLHVDGVYNNVQSISNPTTSGLVVLPEASLTLSEWDTADNVTTAGGTISIKGSNTVANGTFIVPAGTNVNATVEFITKGISAADATKVNQMVWQYFGIPVTTFPAAAMGGAYIRKYNEDTEYATKWWSWLDNSSTMTPATGYEITVKSPHPGAFTFSGQLNTEDKNILLGKTEDKPFSGQHVISNPFTAGLDIKEGIVFGENDGTFEQTVYLFHTGSNEQWSGAEEGTGAGQFLSIPQGNAGNGLPAVIPSMQGFVVMLNEGAATAEQRTLTLKYGGKASGVNIPMRSKEKNRTEEGTQTQAAIQTQPAVYTSVQLLSGNALKDRMWLFTNENSTYGFDNGYDGKKIFGADGLSQLYAVEADGNYQVNTVPDINNTQLWFKAEKGVNEYTLAFNHEHTDLYYRQLVLKDMLTGEETDITNNGSTYSFLAENENQAGQRFTIFSQLKEKQDQQTSLVETFQSGNVILINNRSNSEGIICLYDLSARMIYSAPLQPLASVSIPESKFNSGVYVMEVKLQDNKTIAAKIIVK